jgi:hypothetical protein
MFTKKGRAEKQLGELKSSSLLDRKRATGSPPEKKHHG